MVVANNKVIKAAAIVIIISGILLLMIFGKSLIMPMMIGAFLAMLLVPPVNALERIKFPRALAIFAVIILVLFILYLIGWFFGSQISNFSEDLTDIESRFDNLYSGLSAWINETFGVQDVLKLKNVNDKLFEFLRSNASKITSAAFSTLSSLGLLVLIPVYLFMFLLYRDHFTQFAIRLFKEHSPEKVIDVVTNLRKVVQNYISGMLKVMVILAIMNGIALSILGIKHAFFFAVFAAMLNVVPYVGPLIGSIIPIIFALLTKDSLWYPIGVFIAFNITQTIEGNFLTPKIVGSNVNINPITSLLALLIGGFIWGVLGMVLFIPLAAIIKKLLELSPSTEVYGFLMGEEPSDAPGKKSKIFDWVRQKMKRIKG